MKWPKRLKKRGAFCLCCKKWLDETLNKSPSTALLMQRMELEMLVPEMRLSGSSTRKPCSRSTSQDPLSGRPSRWITSPIRTGVDSLETQKRHGWVFQASRRKTAGGLQTKRRWQWSEGRVAGTIRLSADTSQWGAVIWSRWWSATWQPLVPPPLGPSNGCWRLHRGSRDQGADCRAADRWQCI